MTVPHTSCNFYRIAHPEDFNIVVIANSVDCIFSSQVGAMISEVC